MWNSVEIEPPVGEPLLLTVIYREGGAIEDATNEERVVTIGFLELDDYGCHEWHIVGWDWDQDCLCETPAEVVAWAYRPEAAQ